MSRTGVGCYARTLAGLLEEAQGVEGFLLSFAPGVASATPAELDLLLPALLLRETGS